MHSVVNMRKSSSGYISKPRRKTVFFVLFVIFILCYIYKCPIALDLGRYYEDAANWPPNASIKDIIEKYYYSEFNFIYQTTLVLFDRSFLGAPFLTGIIVSTYYWFLIKNFYNNQFVGANGLYMLGLLGFPPFIYVLTIARTACAVVLLYFGIEAYMNKKWQKCAVFFIAAVFTHIIAGMFIGVFFVAILFNHLFSQRSVKTFNMLCLVLPPLAWIISSVLLPSFLSSNILYGLFSEYNRFETYLGDNYISFAVDSYALSDRTMMTTYLLCGYIILNLSKHYSLKRCLFMTVFVGLCFVGGSNFILMERFMIFCSLFYAMLFSEILSLSGSYLRPLSSMKYRIMKIVGIICFLSLSISLGLARRDFFSFFS